MFDATLSYQSFLWKQPLQQPSYCVQVICITRALYMLEGAHSISSHDCIIATMLCRLTQPCYKPGCRQNKNLVPWSTQNRCRQKLHTGKDIQVQHYYIELSQFMQIYAYFEDITLSACCTNMLMFVGLLEARGREGEGRGSVGAGSVGLNVSFYLPLHHHS